MKFLFLIFALIGCTEKDSKVLSNGGDFYKREVRITFGEWEYEGVAVLPKRKSYDLTFEFAGRLDKWDISDCHGYDSQIKAWEGGIFSDKKTKEYTYENKYEGIDYCPVRVGGYDSQDLKHSWAFMDFESDNDTLPAIVECNWEKFKSKGVTICQSRAGLYQRITFEQKAKIAPNTDCEWNGPNEGIEMEFIMPKGECVFVFKEVESPHRFHRLTTLGFNKVMVVEGDIK